MHRFPDGSTVEWVMDGMVYGPSSTITLHYGTSRLYVRINGGEWEAAPGIRRVYRLREWLEVCDTAEDLRSALE